MRQVTLTCSLGSWEILSALEDKIRIPARQCDILYLHGCVCVLCGFRIPIPTIIVKSVGKAATYLFFLSPLTLAQCCAKHEYLCAELFCYIPSTERFRFSDEYDYEYEIFLILSSARPWTSVILAGKRGSRHHSTTSFRANVVAAKTRYQMLEVLSFCDRETGAPNDNFRKSICLEDDLRSRIFGTFVVKFLACMPLLGFSNKKNGILAHF